MMLPTTTMNGQQRTHFAAIINVSDQCRYMEHFTREAQLAAGEITKKDIPIPEWQKDGGTWNGKERFGPGKEPITVKWFPMSDGGKTKVKEILEKVFPVIDENLKKGEVLVHCSVGVNRSATVVMAYMMRRQKITAARALTNLLRVRPVCPVDSYVKQLKEL